jgi:hypothetical protein
VVTLFWGKKELGRDRISWKQWLRRDERKRGWRTLTYEKESAHIEYGTKSKLPYQFRRKWIRISDLFVLMGKAHMRRIFGDFP